MKRILLVCLCMVLLLPAGVLAQDVTGSLIQPGVYNAKKGQTLNYSFEINLKEGYQKRLKSFNLSIDQEIKYKDGTTITALYNEPGDNNNIFRFIPIKK